MKPFGAIANVPSTNHVLALANSLMAGAEAKTMIRALVSGPLSYITNVSGWSCIIWAHSPSMVKSSSESGTDGCRPLWFSVSSSWQCLACPGVVWHHREDQRASGQRGDLVSLRSVQLKISSLPLPWSHKHYLDQGHDCGKLQKQAYPWPEMSSDFLCSGMNGLARTTTICDSS